MPVGDIKGQIFKKRLREFLNCSHFAQSLIASIESDPSVLYTFVVLTVCRSSREEVGDGRGGGRGEAALPDQARQQHQGQDQAGPLVQERFCYSYLHVSSSSKNIRYYD